MNIGILPHKSVYSYHEILMHLCTGRWDEIVDLRMRVRGKWIFCNSLTTVFIVHLTLINEAGDVTGDAEPRSAAAGGREPKLLSVGGHTQDLLTRRSPA